MAIAIVGYLTIILILLLDLNYKNHCIEDLEGRTKALIKMKNARMMRTLLHIQKMTDITKCYNVLDIRKYVDEEIEQLSKEERAINK